MKHLSISKAWNETIAFVGKEAALLFPIALAFMALPAIVAAHLQPEVPIADAKTIQEMSALMQPFMPQLLLSFAITSLIGAVGGLGITALSLRGGMSVGEAIVLGTTRLPSLIGATLMIGLLWMVWSVFALSGPVGALIGFALFPVMVFVSIRLSLLPPIVIEEGLGPWPLLRRSWSLTQGQFWRLFGFVIIFFVVAFVVSIAVAAVFGIFDRLLGDIAGGGLIGMIASGLLGAVLNAYFMVMIARIYRQLSERQTMIT